MKTIPTVKDLCQEHGFSVYKLGRVMDLSHNTLPFWIKKKNIPLYRIVEIAKILQTDPETVMKSFLQGEKKLFE